MTGVTIHYRGTIDDVGDIETLEDRMLDLVFSMGGRATIWRSFADENPSRVVRGLLVELEPNQDTFSLLISPEGHLTPLSQIDEAEKEPFDEPPACSVKTQFGSLQGHIAIIHLLDALRQRFFSNLEVLDAGGYDKHRDVQQLVEKLQSPDNAIHSMVERSSERGLSAEAAEDPGILAARIERIATLVHQKLLEAPHSPAGDTDREAIDEWSEPSLEDEVEAMEQLKRQSDLRSERMVRRIAEAEAAGMSIEQAFELAMAEEGLEIPRVDADDEYDDSADEAWTASLPKQPFDEVGEHKLGSNHPSIDLAQVFLMDVMDLEQAASSQSSFHSVLSRAALDIFGGLAQATSDELDDNLSRALAIVQLKRALSGHAYARGAVLGLQSENAITEEQSKLLQAQLEAILQNIHELSEVAWTMR
jgi:hypothetical protein